MKLIVNPHKIELQQDQAVNEKEIDISKCEFEFADEITNEYVKEAYFTLNGDTYKKIIVNDECTFPQEVLVKEGTVEIGVVAYLVENEQEIKRYNPTPAYFKTDLGSLKDAENSESITPSEMEQYEQELQDGLAEVNDKLDEIDTAITETNNLNIDANKVDTTTTITLTKKDGTTKQVQVLDGVNGVDGRDGIDGKDGVNGTNGVDGYSPIATVRGRWEVDAPMKLVASDMTMIRHKGVRYEWTYLLDTFNNEIISSHITDVVGDRRPYFRCLEDLIEKTKEQAFPVILHTDQGSVYSSEAFFNAHKNSNIIRSMSRAGTPTDNPVIEAINGWIKDEIYSEGWHRRFSSAEEMIKEYIHYYNNERPAFALQYKSPVQYKTEMGFV